ncbi:MAG TPA: hypothetical protein VGU23_09285 [Acidobacteriaceae bacterium]|nr:hypothetical protein [Acidobacteriaceae bacterium]
MTTSLDIATLPSPSVEIDEMAFAIALFVAAADGKVPPPSAQSHGFPLAAITELSSDPLLLGAKAILGKEDERVSDEVPLACAVSVLWHHYDRDARQQAICARLVAFYSLMVRSRGVLLGPWMENTKHDAQSVLLAPAIIKTVATAPLGESGQFNDAEFKALAQSFAERNGNVDVLASPTSTKQQLQRPVAPLPVTGVVQQLTLHLLAFQACVAAIPDSDGTPQFRVVEQLCTRVAEMSGSTGLQIMLTRALRATHADFPWLGSVNASNSGAVQGLDRVQPPPNLHEAMRCEMAILGSLIELLRSFLGDGVTLQLLRSLWPLANLDSEAFN